MCLEMLLGCKVDGVTVSAEYSMLFSSEYRSIRLDVYSMDGGQSLQRGNCKAKKSFLSVGRKDF